MSEKNIIWINMVKALCIIFVYLRHSQLYYGWRLPVEIEDSYSTFYVNGFFFVSGYLLFWKQLSSPRIDEDKLMYTHRNGGGIKLFNNVMFRIVIPSIIFSVIEFVPSSIIQDREMTMGNAFCKTIGGGTYWFTSALAVAELLLLLMLCSRKRNVWLYVVASFCLSVMGLKVAQNGITNEGIWAWKQGLIALFFLAIGGLYWRYEDSIDKVMRLRFIIPLFIIYIAMIIGLKGYNDPLISTLNIQPLGFVTSVIACIMIVWLCKILPEWKLLTFIGQNTLGFYFLSGALPILFGKLVYIVIPETNGWLLPVIWITCLVVAYVFVQLINKWLPWMWDLRKVSLSI